MNLFSKVYYGAFALANFILPTSALHRTIGPSTDRRFQNASEKCGASDPALWEFGGCSILISCIMENIEEAFKASLGVGTSIVSLLPTILALIGSPPLDLVQLSLLSPHRALATCCFSIGLPSGLFRQLKPVHRQLSQGLPHTPSVREWTVPLPALSTNKRVNLAAKITADLAIISAASVMLWRNMVVNTYTMVPWRCEYSYLLFAWPLACMAWLLLAVVLLQFMKASTEIYLIDDPSIRYTLWELMLLPYSFGDDRIRRFKMDSTILGTDSEEAQAASKPPEVTATHLRTLTPIDSPIGNQGHQLHRRSSQRQPRVKYDDDCVRVRITMPSNIGLRSWRTYEAILEASAVGIYLYATFVLTSSLFLNADNAMVFSVVMALNLCLIRILSILF